MAQRQRQVAENRPGAVFVDDTCIDCDTCRQLAPMVFADSGEHSYVARQPEAPEALRAAQRAALACPTNSIGIDGPGRAAAALADFPLPIAEGVAYCGYTSPDSFGGSSYLISRAGGNWLVDAPRWSPPLVARLQELGGISDIFLTHQDDVADADRYARRFAARRHIHRADRHAAPGAEEVFAGDQPFAPGPDLLIIPTPGHTAGHSVLLLRGSVLFSGDHLWWDRERQRLGASATHCWHSWSEQIASMERLADHDVSWVLPGHGDRVRLPPGAWGPALADLLARMRAVRRD